MARKIVFVSAGTLSNADKVNFAVVKGAAAVVICDKDDEVYGLDLTGIYYTNPVAAITRSDTQAIMAASTKISDIAYTGTMTVYGRTGAGVTGAYTMSDFSSWGVPGSLTLKPEITAPGGNIRSVWGSNPISGGSSDQYETMSGTSMAAPQVAGMTALLARVDLAAQTDSFIRVEGQEDYKVKAELGDDPRLL